ncbi:hypothetical protein GCM10009789_52550 [Kribbella sancticallisti]|uniref:SGNH hydrolase-type esterase domain-containing protein n=1 Tax=Kribbella sancticallisti TaxID=460087 RepID=A0ABN2E2H8_9ACTN
MADRWRGPNRRQFLLGGAVVAASAVATTETAAAGPFGSGDLGPWQHLVRAISTEAQIQRVLDTDGVFMFGDSLAVQDGKTLAQRLAARTGDALAVHNWSGQPSSAAVDALARWKQSYGLPRRILMAMGSNDIFSPPAVAGQVDRAMDLIGSTRTMIWVNVQVVRAAKTVSVQLADQRNSAWVNVQLADAQRRHSNLRIVRWAEYLAAKPNRLGLYLRDGLHTSVPLGQAARNDLMVQALATARSTGKTAEGG